MGNGGPSRLVFNTNIVVGRLLEVGATVWSHSPNCLRVLPARGAPLEAYTLRGLPSRGVYLDAYTHLLR